MTKVTAQQGLPWGLRLARGAAPPHSGNLVVLQDDCDHLSQDHEEAKLFIADKPKTLKKHKGQYLDCLPCQICEGH